MPTKEQRPPTILQPTPQQVVDFAGTMLNTSSFRVDNTTKIVLPNDVQPTSQDGPQILLANRFGNMRQALSPTTLLEPRLSSNQQELILPTVDQVTQYVPAVDIAEKYVSVSGSQQLSGYELKTIQHEGGESVLLSRWSREQTEITGSITEGFRLINTLVTADTQLAELAKKVGRELNAIEIDLTDQSSTGYTTLAIKRKRMGLLQQILTSIRQATTATQPVTSAEYWKSLHKKLDSLHESNRLSCSEELTILFYEVKAFMTNRAEQCDRLPSLLTEEVVEHFYQFAVSLQLNKSVGYLVSTDAIKAMVIVGRTWSECSGLQPETLRNRLLTPLLDVLLHVRPEQSARHQIYNFLYDLHPDKHEQRAQLLQLMTSFNDQDHKLCSLLLEDQICSNNHDQTTIEMLAQRDYLLKQLTKDPQKLFDQFDMLAAASKKLPAYIQIEAIEQSLTPKKAGVELDIGLVAQLRQLISIVPSGWSFGTDTFMPRDAFDNPVSTASSPNSTLGHVVELRKNSSDLQFSPEFAQQTFKLGSWLQSSFGSSGVHTHVHVDQAESVYPPSFGLLRVATGRKGLKTHEVRSKQPVYDTDGQFRADNLLSFICFLQLSTQDVNPNVSKIKLDNPLSTYNWKQLVFGHICAMTTNPQTRFYGLMCLYSSDHSVLQNFNQACLAASYQLSQPDMIGVLHTPQSVAVNNQAEYMLPKYALRLPTDQLEPMIETQLAQLDSVSADQFVLIGVELLSRPEYDSEHALAYILRGIETMTQTRSWHNIHSIIDLLHKIPFTLSFPFSNTVMRLLTTTATVDPMIIPELAHHCKELPFEKVLPILTQVLHLNTYDGDSAAESLILSTDFTDISQLLTIFESIYRTKAVQAALIRLLNWSGPVTADEQNRINIVISVCAHNNTLTKDNPTMSSCMTLLRIGTSTNSYLTSSVYENLFRLANTSQRLPHEIGLNRVLPVIRYLQGQIEIKALDHSDMSLARVRGLVKLLEVVHPQELSTKVTTMLLDMFNKGVKNGIADAVYPLYEFYLKQQKISDHSQVFDAVIDNLSTARLVLLILGEQWPLSMNQWQRVFTRALHDCATAQSSSSVPSQDELRRKFNTDITLQNCINLLGNCPDVDYESVERLYRIIKTHDHLHQNELLSSLFSLLTEVSFVDQRFVTLVTQAEADFPQFTESLINNWTKVKLIHSKGSVTHEHLAMITKCITANNGNFADAYANILSTYST